MVHGAVTQDVFADLVGQSHILILPSFYEGLPLVLLEGLAAGCRIVATDLPGVKELMGNFSEDYIRLVKTPRLQNMDQPYAEDERAFEDNLSQAIRSQMQAVLRSPQIDLTAFQAQISSFTWRSIFKRVEEVYCHIVTREGG
jgi:glycosyltransferase involved in cell wall biosynthesis